MDFLDTCLYNIDVDTEKEYVIPIPMRFLKDPALAPRMVHEHAQLCRAARAVLGETPHRAWQKMKMQWAQVLLRESTLSITQVAERLGFGDPFYFSRVFKAHAGASPSDWRRGRMPLLR